MKKKKSPPKKEKRKKKSRRKLVSDGHPVTWIWRIRAINNFKIVYIQANYNFHQQKPINSSYKLATEIWATPCFSDYGISNVLSSVRNSLTAVYIPSLQYLAEVILMTELRCEAKVASEIVLVGRAGTVLVPLVLPEFLAVRSLFTREIRPRFW